MRVVRALPMVALALGLLGSCGGTTRHDGGDAATTAGKSSTSPGSGAGGESPAKGGSSAGGSSSHPVAGSADAGEPSSGGTGIFGASGEAGQAGEPDPTNPATTDCNQPYAGPSGGPRADGPLPTGSCATIADALILARYKDARARVAMGLYYEPADSIVFWAEPCAASLADTVQRSASANLGSLTGQFTTTWFYEAAYCQNGLRRLYRNLRCDYFDGQKLQPATDENLAFLGSLLWWLGHYNLGGSALIGFGVTVGNATDRVELCSISTTLGDFGLCDEVRLESTTDTIVVGGPVTLGTPLTVKTLKGDCH